ncbi:MAG TPA: hypothetical protein VGG89_07625 [Candidatus Baltobacteraceae bacterium]|jgi:hypothetical protein
MDHSTRLQFLRILGLATAAPFAATSPLVAAADASHAFIASPQPDGGEERLWHGYPDECYAFTSFADSLVALAWGHGWYAQPPMVDLRNAIVVDFASSTEEAAEASITRGWNGAWEFPMGVVNTVASRVEMNAQNARIERNLSLIGTAMRQAEFHENVVNELFDRRLHPDCGKCEGRPERTLADVFRILAHGTDQVAVQLFSKWDPSPALRESLSASRVAIIHHPLDSIPREDLEANRYYHIWDGSPLQAEQFRRTVWAPAWRRA